MYMYVLAYNLYTDCLTTFNGLLSARVFSVLSSDFEFFVATAGSLCSGRAWLDSAWLGHLTVACRSHVTDFLYADKENKGGKGK